MMSQMGAEVIKLKVQNEWIIRGINKVQINGCFTLTAKKIIDMRTPEIANRGRNKTADVLVQQFLVWKILIYHSDAVIKTSFIRHRDLSDSRKMPRLI
jgi:hypothetical protein